MDEIEIADKIVLGTASPASANKLARGPRGPYHKVKKDKLSFKTVVPDEFHQRVYEWHITGMTQTGIALKLHQEFHLPKYNFRTIGRLIEWLKIAKRELTTAIIADQTQKQVLGDFEELQRLYNDLKTIAAEAYGVDNNLYLRTTDRMTKLLQIKFNISMQPDKKDQTDHNVTLELMIAQLGR